MIKSLFTAVFVFLLAITSYSQEYKLNTSASKIEWLAKKLTGQHNGTINFTAGTFSWDKGIIKGGTFTVDMNSIIAEDIKDPGYNAKFIDHLKTDDFFNTAKFATSSLTIKNASGGKDGKYKIVADLTIKGIKKEITFDAVIKQDGDKVKASATVVVDRSKFDIRYGSKSFFPNIGDKMIDDEFTLTLNLEFTK